MRQAERAKKRYTDEYQRLTDSKDQLAAERVAIQEERKEITNAKKALAEQRASLDKRESDLAEQRDEAESGFAKLREARLGKLENELDELRTKWEASRAARLEEFQRRLTRREEVANTRIAELEGKLIEREQRVMTAEGSLLERERAVRRAETNAKAHADVLRQQEHDIRIDMEQRFHKRMNELTFQVDDWKTKFEAVDKISRQRQVELNDIRSAYLNVGSPQLAEEKIGQLLLEVQELRRASYEDTPLLRERHDYLEQRVGELEAERSVLVQRNAELMRGAELNRISVAERETNRLVTESLKSRYALLKTEHDALRLEVDQYQERQEGQSPFQKCSLMDDNKEFQVSPEFPSSAPALADLVHRVSHLIAAKGRYFSAHDLRCFVGGLAMSRLHLLQGISGIGKTSLPRDFAAAIDAECVVVPVAAEWRSPQDLMGYYNSFERRFYESAFTKALYKAQQPLYVSKPFLIVLDEMNLSHPEQYFSDVLAALELPPSGEPQKLVLELMSGRVDPAPRLFEDGYKLVIPDNVWFIGTANQDETTVAFADKTYDRAHITELPARPTRFTAETVEQIRPFSTRALTTRFTQAQAKHQTEIELVKSFLEALSDFTRTEFGFTTAPRLLDRQLEKFVSTVIAAGGSPAEAADHLAATKLLRKFHGRVEIRKDRLKPMLDRLNDEWHIFDVDPVPDGNEKWPEPQESLTVINNEIRDRDGW